MSWFYKHIHTRILKAKRGISDEVSLGLNRRERQVFGLIGSGVSRSDISQLLNIGVKTVDEYKRRIKKKLNLKNDADIANKLRDRYEKI
jgi:DNA-binding CsgD family transcriptional regulator